MTRRRIMYSPNGIGFWLSPELRGDKDELEANHSSDACDLTWLELKALFMGVQNLEAFEVACTVAQLTFHPACGSTCPQPPTFHLTLEDTSCDELYIIRHGVVERVYGTNLHHVQIYYPEQDSRTVDTVTFDCPPGVTEADIKQAIRDTMQHMPCDEDDDRISYMDDVLTCASQKLHATWTYLSIDECIEVDC